MKTTLNRSIHLLAQPQAGIGKSYIAFLLKQYLEERGAVKYYYIQEKNISLWDDIFSVLYEQNEINFIIAVNSNCYVDFVKYLKEIKFFESFLSSKNLLFNHFIFTPGRTGESLKSTLDFTLDTIDRMPGNNVVWENDNLGTTILNCTKGQCSRLGDFPEFKKIKKSVYTIVYLAAENFYFQKDLSNHIRSGITFNKAIYNTKNDIIFRQRLYKIKKRIFEAMNNGNI